MITFPKKKKYRLKIMYRKIILIKYLSFINNNYFIYTISILGCRTENVLFKLINN